MRFRISRTSDYLGLSPPYEGAECVEPPNEDDYSKGVWVIEVLDLAALLRIALARRIIVSAPDERSDVVGDIEIYDDYRE